MALSKKPTTGMKDILPEEMQIRDYVISVIKDTYGKFGFTSIETPCVEHIENLCSKQGGDNEKLTFELSPFFLALLAFCFSMTIGVLWEFFEFFMDTFLHTDMQKDTIIHTIHSVTLDPTRSNQVVTIHNIQDVAVNGSSLGLPGYLDIGLIDTMKDLMVNFLGALVFSVTGFFYARSKGKKKTPAQNFVPSKKTADRDYLQQARQALTPPEEPPEDP